LIKIKLIKLKILALSLDMFTQLMIHSKPSAQRIFKK